MRRKIALLLALVLIIVPLSACGGSGTQTAATTAAPATTAAAGEAQTTAAAPATTTAAPASSSAPVFVSIGTAQLGGGAHNSGLAMAAAANVGQSKYKIDALPTSGQIETANMLRDGEVEIGCFGIDVAYELYYGTDRYDNDEWKDLRMLFPQFATYVNIIVPKNSPIQSIEDMRGKKVGLSNPGSAGFTMIRQILEAHGLKDGDYQDMALTAPEQATALKDGHLDVFGFFTTPNSPAIVELATTMDVRWIPIDVDKWAAYADEHGLPFGSVDVEAGTYKGMDVDVATLSGMNIMVSGAGVSEDIVYEFTKAFFDNFDIAVETVPSIADIKELLPTAVPVVPWHPGAVKYFKEAGMSYIEYTE